MIRRWLKAGILEDGELYPNEKGTPQGGSISVLLSNLYLHYVLDLWFAHIVKPRLRGEAYLVRYIDDFVVCFQYREDALRLQELLCKRLGKFGLALEPTKTKLVEFGRFAQRHAGKRGRNRPEKTRVNRSMDHLRDLMRRMRHLPVREQVINLNQVLRGHYGYYGIAGNFRSLQRVYRFVERYWRKMLCSRSRNAYIPWEIFHQIKERYPLQRPKLRLPYRELQRLAVL